MTFVRPELERLQQRLRGWRRAIGLAAMWEHVRELYESGVDRWGRPLDLGMQTDLAPVALSWRVRAANDVSRK